MLKSICSICNCKKSSFTKSETKTGKGMGDTIIKTIDKIGELHLPANKGEYVQNGSFNNLQKYSYCGPGTKYDQRVKEGYNGMNLRQFIPRHFIPRQFIPDTSYCDISYRRHFIPTTVHTATIHTATVHTDDTSY